jgi:hypothetical protein
MNKESIITIANRYADSIKGEIGLLSKRIEKDVEENNYGGFTWHNLASPCEMLNEYFGDKLRAAGYANLVLQINNIGRTARDFDSIIKEISELENHNYDSIKRKTQFPDALSEIDYLQRVQKFIKHLENLVPVLFFI